MTLLSHTIIKVVGREKNECEKSTLASKEVNPNFVIIIIPTLLDNRVTKTQLPQQLNLQYGILIVIK